MIGGYQSADATSTTWVWGLHADAHDFNQQLVSNSRIAARIFATHFGHLSVVSAWFAASLVAGARFSNYSAWLSDPFGVKPTAQVVYLGSGGLGDTFNGDAGSGTAGLRVTSGLFSVWRAAGISSQSQLFGASVAFLALAVLLLVAGWYHHHLAQPEGRWFNDTEAILSHHISAVVGLGSLGWCGHLLHVALPVDGLLRLGVDPDAIPTQVVSLASSVGLSGLAGDVLHVDWVTGPSLTCYGGLSPLTGSLWLTDVAHHHLALGVVALIAGHMYRTQFGIGMPFAALLAAHETSIMDSWHAQLSINLGVLGTAAILFGHSCLGLPSYPFLALDWSTQLSLFTHHAWIGGFLIVGSGSHAAMYCIQDYRVGALRSLERVVAHRHSITAHLNWVSIFLGFHSFGLYVHNDTLSALGRQGDCFSDEGIPFRPVVGMLGQFMLGPVEGVIAPGTGYLTARLVGTADLLVHHVHAFTIHVTALVLLKGVFFARSSRLVTDKAVLGYRFPCDGPGRGGT